MKPFAIGLAVAVVILAAGFLAPLFVPTAIGPNTRKALEEAELARRQLYAHDATLPLVEAHSDLEQLKEVDFGTLAARAQEALAKLNEEFNKRVREAKAYDRKSGMPESDLRALAPSEAGVRSAVNTFEEAVRDNRKLLEDALRSSRSASQADRKALGVEQVVGIVKLTEAQELLAQARRSRTQLAAAQGRALAVAVDWATAKAERDYYAGLEVARIRSDLNADLEEIETALQGAQSEADELARAVADREQTLAGLRAELEQLRTQRLNMEEMGFTVGDDASFEAYRAKYVQLAERLQDLQNQEQLLAFGGTRGGTVVDEDLVGGEIEGGEKVVGLNELQSRLAIAQDKLERYTRGRKALEDQIRLVSTVGDEAAARQGEYAGRLEALTEEVDQIRAQMAELAGQASEQEDAALRAAREAAAAFKDSKSAVDRWISDARSLQQQADPQRGNERLRQIVGDSVAPEFADSSEAQAKTLVGRIQTERALRLARYRDTLARIAELTGGTLEAGTLQEQFDTARDEAIGALAEARDAYERLAQKQTDTSWAYRASLAVVYHLLWQIDEFNAEQHRSNLIDQLGRVVAAGWQYPELQQEVELYRWLTGRTEPPQPGSEEAATPREEEAAEEGEGE